MRTTEEVLLLVHEGVEELELHPLGDLRMQPEAHAEAHEVLHRGDPRVVEEPVPGPGVATEGREVRIGAVEVKVRGPGEESLQYHGSARRFP